MILNRERFIIMRDHRREILVGAGPYRRFMPVGNPGHTDIRSYRTYWQALKSMPDGAEIVKVREILEEAKL